MSAEQDIRSVYSDARVAAGYVPCRLAPPLGAALHARQAGLLDRVVRGLPPGASVLEIAPGPARLTAELDLPPGCRGFLLEASEPMVKVGRARLAEAGRAGAWRWVRANAFAPPFLEGRFDLVYSFRLIRHFEAADRARLYGAIRGLLRPGGRLVFDAVNAVRSAPLRAAAPEQYPIFDALFERGALLDELRANGLEPLALEGVNRWYGAQSFVQRTLGRVSFRLARPVVRALEALPGGRPLEWVVVCRRG